MDNYAIHKTTEIQAWMAHNSRTQAHFPPICPLSLDWVEV